MLLGLMVPLSGDNDLGKSSLNQPAQAMYYETVIGNFQCCFRAKIFRFTYNAMHLPPLVTYL